MILTFLVNQRLLDGMKAHLAGSTDQTEVIFVEKGSYLEWRIQNPRMPAKGPVKLTKIKVVASFIARTSNAVLS